MRKMFTKAFDEVSGNIEQFYPPNSVAGSVTSKVGSQPRQIGVFIDENLIQVADLGSPRPWDPRPDVAGFDVKICESVGFFDLMSGRLQVWVIGSRSEKIRQILPTPDLAATVRLCSALLDVADLKRSGKPALDGAFLRAKAQPTMAVEELSILSTLNTLRGADPAYHSLIASGKPVVPASDLTPLLLPVGIVSADQSAILGRGGYIFLIGGTNKLLDAYAENPDAVGVQANADAWYSTFKRRHAFLSEQKIRYVQTIFPEKATALRDLVPLDIVTPTAKLRVLEEKIAADPDLSPAYVSGARVLAAHEDERPLFLRADSHFTPYGTWVVFKSIMANLGFDVGEPPEFPRTRATFGDLAARFFNISFLDERHEAVFDLDDRFRSEAVLTYEKLSPSYVGLEQSWLNPNAPFDVEVMAFGNSFFGPANDQQNSMSFWFARYFKRYHTIWRSDMDHERVERVRPDIVICQTIERFLSTPPKS